MQTAAFPVCGIKVKSSYPNQYEINIFIDEIGEMLIRPIPPEDAPLLLELFYSLSYKSVYFRFFSPMKKLSRRLLLKFTEIDYLSEIALVAIQTKNGDDKMLGLGEKMGMHIAMEPGVFGYELSLALKQ